MNYEHHEAADAFPMMDAKRYEELKADIEKQGLRVPITLCDGKILDGRNRNKACEELGIEAKCEVFTGDPWSYVWSLNGERRDLVADQRYLIWKHCEEQSEAFQATQRAIAEEANQKRSKAAKGNKNASKGSYAEASRHGFEEHMKNSSGTGCSTTVSGGRHKTKQAAAAASKTNPGAVARGDKLAKHRPDLAEKVRTGELKPAEAHRQMRRDEVADKVAALPTGKYRVIYADPPWAYNDKCDEGAIQSAGVEKHYPAMTLSQLSALAIADLAATDSVLFLWVTSPLLPDGLKLAGDWGFKYKASFVWDKVKHNMGHYNSVRHEFLLVCTKGSCVPDVAKLFDSVVSVERTKHSEKPEEFRNIIDTIYTHGKRIELFARTTTKGWDHWGNEV